MRSALQGKFDKAGSTSSLRRSIGDVLAAWGTSRLGRGLGLGSFLGLGVGVVFSLVFSLGLGSASCVLAVVWGVLDNTQHKRRPWVSISPMPNCPERCGCFAGLTWLGGFWSSFHNTGIVFHGLWCRVVDWLVLS